MKLFGPAMNIFRQAGIWHVGRFLDSGHYTSGPNEGREMPPYFRRQEVFGASAGLKDAFRFAFGESRVYSGAGGSRGISMERRGYRPVIDKHGRVRGFESPAGVFSKNFPSDTITTA
jgi:hypothetical protein